MAKSDFAFRYPFRVRWSETDAQGVVFNARFLDYADIAITEYWRNAGLNAANAPEPFDTHVKKATILWSAPILPDEMIEVMARTSGFGNSSMTQLVEIHGAREDGGDDLRAQIELIAVHVDLDSHRPMPMPQWVRDRLSAYDAGAMESEAQA